MDIIHCMDCGAVYPYSDERWDGVKRCDDRECLSDAYREGVPSDMGCHSDYIDDAFNCAHI